MNAPRKQHWLIRTVILAVTAVPPRFAVAQPQPAGKIIERMETEGCVALGSGVKIGGKETRLTPAGLLAAWIGSGDWPQSVTVWVRGQLFPLDGGGIFGCLDQAAGQRD